MNIELFLSYELSEDALTYAIKNHRQYLDDKVHAMVFRSFESMVEYIFDLFKIKKGTDTSYKIDSNRIVFMTDAVVETDKSVSDFLTEVYNANKSDVVTFKEIVQSCIKKVRHGELPLSDIARVVCEEIASVLSSFLDRFLTEDGYARKFMNGKIHVESMHPILLEYFTVNGYPVPSVAFDEQVESVVNWLKDPTKLHMSANHSKQ